MNDSDALFAHLAHPSTRAVAYFSHADLPSLEYRNAMSVRTSVGNQLRRGYDALGIPRQDVMAMITRSSQNLGLDYAYIHTCHSADDMSLRDYLVGSGGTYWGHVGVLWAPQALTDYSRP